MGFREGGVVIAVVAARAWTGVVVVVVGGW